MNSKKGREVTEQLSTSIFPAAPWKCVWHTRCTDLGSGKSGFHHRRWSHRMAAI